MWCSHVRYPLKKLLEYNPKYFSKNGFIQMIERSYIDGEFRAGGRSFHIYCTVCDSLVLLQENTIECANKHLNECIAKTAKRHLAYSKPVRKNVKKRGRVESELSENEINEICRKYTDFPSRGFHAHNTSLEFRKKTAYHIFNSAKAIQRVWRTHKLGPETWAQRVWNMVRNDGTPDEKKFMGITPRKIRVPDDRYIDYIWDPSYLLAGINYGDRIQAKDMPAHYQNLPILYDHYTPQSWAERKREQLNNRLALVSYIVAFIELHRQGYRIVNYSGWTYMLKWLSNLEYYHIDRYLNNGNKNFVRSSEYARYIMKSCGTMDSCNLREIDYYSSGSFYFQGKDVIIDFSDFNNNCEYVQRIFRTIESILK
jgi:hypothetical protein